MSNFKDLIQAITVKHNDKIKRSCRKLFSALNLCDFWYWSLNSKGEFSVFCYHAEWTEFFVDQKLYLDYPFYRAPRLLENSIFCRGEEDNSPHGKLLQSSTVNFGMQFCVSVRTKIGNDQVEEFGFSSTSGTSEQRSLIINELDTLRLFVNFFKNENRQILSLMKENQINLSNLIGSSFYKIENPLKLKSQRKKSILRSLGIVAPDFTGREKEVLYQLLNGGSARLIGSTLNISRRTVEHHIERLKDKFNCNSKAELIQKAREIESLNCLDRSRNELI